MLATGGGEHFSVEGVQGEDSARRTPDPQLHAGASGRDRCSGPAFYLP
jgi:hypothetical protein